MYSSSNELRLKFAPSKEMKHVIKVRAAVEFCLYESRKLVDTIAGITYRKFTELTEEEVQYAKLIDDNAKLLRDSLEARLKELS
jgi:hypothetical protein